VIEKYFLIVLASFSIIVALLYPISKINLLRFLFGMRTKKRRKSLDSQILMALNHTGSEIMIERQGKVILRKRIHD